jgi:DNA-binding IclR family transcriptional regulator
VSSPGVLFGGDANKNDDEPSGMLMLHARRSSLRATQHAMTRTRVDSGRHAGNGASRASPRTGSRTPHVLAVRHAVEMLRCLASDTPLLGVSEIASVVGMHKSSVSRMVATLEEDGLVERDPASRRIRLGPGLLSLAAPLLASVRVVETAQPQLVELAQRSGETISISVWDGAGAVNLAQVLGRKAVKHYAAPGSRNPAHASASGKLLLAFASADTADRVLRRELRRFTPRTICTRSALLAEIATIRRQGYAVNEGELSLDVGGLAAAIRNDSANVVAAITATVPMYRFATTNRRQLVELVRDAADRVSARLGHARAEHHANR